MDRKIDPNDLEALKAHPLYRESCTCPDRTFGYTGDSPVSTFKMDLECPAHKEIYKSLRPVSVE